MKKEEEKKNNSVPGWVVKLYQSGEVETILVSTIVFLIWGSFSLLHFDPINNMLLEILIIITIISIISGVFFYVEKKLTILEKNKEKTKRSDKSEEL